MSDEIICPSCQRALTAAVPAGTLVQCPLCERRFHVGEEAQDEPPLQARLASTEPMPDEDEPFEEEQPRTAEPAVLLGRPQTIWLTWLLIGQLTLQGFYVFLSLNGGGRPISRDLGAMLHVGFLFLSLAAGVAFLWWVARVAANQPALAVEGNRLTPSGAVISMLFPVLNLFLIPQIFHELWRSSDPHAIDDTQQWKESRSSPLVSAWWTMLLVIVFLALCRYIQSAHWDVFDDLRFGHNPVTDAFDFSICHFSWFAAMLQLCLVRQIMLRQTERQANLFALADEEPADESSDSYGEEETPPQA